MAENMNFEEMLEDYLPIEQEKGQVITGKVVRKDSEYAYLEIENKNEGRILLSEFDNDVNIDDEIEGQIMGNDDEYVIISKRALEEKKLFDEIKVGDILTGKISKQLKNGYIFKSGILKTFLPFAQAGIKKGDNAIGREFDVIVKNKTNKKITVSRIELLDKINKEFFDKYEVGSLIEGKISKLLDFGAVVALDRLNGFIHISEISWKNIGKISNALKVGDKKVFKIIDINKEDRNIKLSLKQLEENPWNKIKEKYQDVEIVEGIVKEILNFGILVEIEKDVEAFMYISDITNRKISNLNAIFKVGDKIRAKITKLDDEKQRIQLSSRVLLEEILDNISEKYQKGDIKEGRVINVQDYGIFVEMPDKVEVFIHKNEYSWNNEDIKFDLDDVVTFKLIKVDADEKKLSGSIRETLKSPFEEATEQYEVGDVLDVEITDIIDAGALTPLTENFKALIPKKELAVEFVKKTTDVVKVGDQVRAVVIEINPEKKSIILSIREALDDIQEEEIEE